MRIVFLCPPATKINGGIKYIFRMAEALCALGHDAVVFEAHKTRPNWFASTAPVVGPESLAPHPGQILVLPEDQPEILKTCATWPQRKVVYCQNHFYAALGVRDGGGYADFGVTHILCSSQTIAAYCRHRHPTIPSSVIPCAVDAALFHPRQKHEAIAYLPRKRLVESFYIRDLFRFDHSEFRDVPWLSLDNTPENRVAETMGGASVFLALNRLDGFGLTPIEAMASGCVVAGFTGIGGRDYATPENGFWAEEDDFPGVVRQLAEAVKLSRETGPRRDAYAQAAVQIAAAYTPETFTQAVKTAWADIAGT